VVGVIMGSRSDWETLQHACAVLDQLEIPYEAEVVSAHRTPDRLFDYAEQAAGRGLQLIIAGAGGAAHLPGMCAAKTLLPVLGVPVQSRVLQGVDSLLSIVQMPAGIPVATLAIGTAGATNAGLLAAAILALQDPGLAARLASYRQAQTDRVLADARLVPDAQTP
jgi:5-(carboxyamino)imidazole ribonucleotide mutase